MATKKSASKRTPARKGSSKSSQKGRGKVEKVMHEFKHHELRSGGRKKVTNPKQAIAIALSEAREAGADIPRKGASARKSSRKKAGGGRKSTSGSSRKSSAKRGAKTAAKRSGSTASRGKRAAGAARKKSGARKSR